MITEMDIVWAAGFWEGEGSISLRFVTASQVNKWPLERLLLMFGGTISVRASSRINQRNCYQWFVCGQDARNFVALIYPYLSPRRQQQINEKFITEEKRVRIRASVKQTMTSVNALRQRNSDGTFNHAKVS
jgi:hypothetical protein